ncbi:hypothetical protein [Acetanaerobacterium elongatum]|uniref:Uncharacterized protein n=1 Tax=Acetanaerobacterium elongatum TaxID=258515 RepID=A0A1H0G7B9_9FIRM|nr:hypothetical protein [Acetanaerobacterium elongatum]SDO02762.1 hypothetical protein SAMN05192585_14811 [Acetanaerobacterium elongatum]
MKKRIFIFLMLVITISINILNISVFATDKSIIETVPIIHISGSEDILILTEDDIISGSNHTLALSDDKGFYENRKIEPFSYVATYQKTITIFAIHEDLNPSFSDWPQSVWYTETSPAGNNRASGDLYLTSVTRRPGVGSQWDLTYSGTLSYLHP